MGTSHVTDAEPLVAHGGRSEHHGPQGLHGMANGNAGDSGRVLYVGGDEMKRIDKIRSLREAEAAGQIRALAFYDAEIDATRVRFDFLHPAIWKQTFVGISFICPEGAREGVYRARKAINKWLAKNGVGASQLVAPPKPHGYADDVWEVMR